MNLQTLRVDGQNIADAVARFATVGRTGGGGVERISFSDEDRRARELLRQWWQQLGLNVTVDAAGNMFGHRAGAEALPPIMLGSHLDTVPAGGRFDGALGVIVATEIIRCLNDAGVATRHPLTVVNFTAEEPSQFGSSTIGSRAFVGRLQERELSAEDGAGRTLAEAIDQVGGNAAQIHTARRQRGDVGAFLELHIEQGKVLDDADVPIGIVTHIAGIRRLQVQLTGEANHAGTTRLGDRKDALTTAAEIVLAVEQLARAEGNPAVGTVGRIEVFPNAPNIVPGAARLTVEFRHVEPAVLTRLVTRCRGRIDAIAAGRNVIAQCQAITDTTPVPMDEIIVDALARVCDRMGVSPIRLPSMAGHDAGHVATIAPTGMIFVASRDGKSHTSEEWSDPEAITLGAQVMLKTVLELDAVLSKGGRSA